jgi:hypothetical protein
MPRTAITVARAALWLAVFSTTALGADLVSLSPQTWDRYAPDGKEVDAIHGDYVLANDQIIAVVARPGHGRNANMTVREVGGCLIDLTRRDHPNDQLSAFYPGAQFRTLRFGGIEVEAPEVYETAELDRVFVRGKSVTLRLVASPRERTPDVEVAYTLQDGWPYVLVTTTFANRSDRELDAELLDSVRADRSFQRCPDGPLDLFWVYDRYFDQAYGVQSEGHKVLTGNARATLLRYQNSDGKVEVRLKPRESYKLMRRVIPGDDLFKVRSIANRLSNRAEQRTKVLVRSEGKLVAGAEVRLAMLGALIGAGRTNAAGVVEIDTGSGPAELTVSEPAHGTLKRQLGEAAESLTFDLPPSGVVIARIIDGLGGPIPCKVQFTGRDGTPTPDFGPDSGEHAVKNLYYSHDGSFRRELIPGSYDVIVSYGPEYDAVFKTIEVARDKETKLEATLTRSVKTEGWISADFHSHASPSGDNTSSQLGRVLNLLCEQVEYAPCTEHNRISTYDPHLKKLGAERLMGTCSGIELTGQPLPINHQNAFPLVMRPGLQDNGAPTSDGDPEVQIERLALWDHGSEKLVQVNHPDMGWMFYDRNGDGIPDSGYSGMAGHMDVIEVHPPAQIFDGPIHEAQGKSYNNTIFNWLQLLNRGKRIPGVVNTDAHYNFHGSGWLRNYLKSPTDDPAAIKVLDVVHAAEQGKLVMTNGPFLEVAVRAGKNGSAMEVGPGENLSAPGGDAMLHVRVQCPNWFDVDRVQIFVNGRPVESLNFTRKNSADRFLATPLKFDQEIPIKLEGDAHVIVATIGEASKLGQVMGPEHADDRPVAVANPIFVDVDGGGFKANGDPLGKSPVKGGR